MDYYKMTKNQLIAELLRRDVESLTQPKEKEPTGKYWFTYKAGILLASHVESELKNLAFGLGLTYESETDDRVFSTNYRVVVRGKKSQLLDFQSAKDRYFSKLSAV